MARPTPFGTKALAGYVLLTALLTGAMAVTIVRLGDLATTRVASIRSEENEITIAERLRWRGELIVSSARGYLLTGDPVLLARLQDAERSFARDVRTLKRAATSMEASSLVEDVDRASRGYRRLLLELMESRQRPGADSTLVQRFEAELLPARTRFGEALDRLVDDKEGAIEAFYRQAERDQAQLSAQMFCLVGVLVAVCLGIAWYFARLLAASFESEHAALERSRKAVAARDELLGVVAHDLRNPLGAILLKATLLGQTADTDKARRHAEAIGSVAMRMESLIKTLLDVATIEAGRFSVTPVPCGTRELAADANELFENLAASKQIRFECLLPELALCVRADRERILQVLSNLLGNAFKFTPPGGRVTLSVAEEGPVARFSVSDTGPGISEAHLPHLFERFWKHETEGKKGTGLGLFISKGIVEAHGGQLQAESHPGAGSTFSFTVPLSAARVASAPPHLVRGPSSA
jgi:signal transduction histidine kinase